MDGVAAKTKPGARLPNIRTARIRGGIVRDRIRVIVSASTDIFAALQ